jgi:dTDP-4-amino-4,6-dideoxygalactose transaminase
VSLFLRRRRYLLYREEPGDILRAIARGDVVEGPAVEELESALAAYHGGLHVHAVNSGRVALLTLLEALGLRPGDEILVPAYTLRALIELLEDSGYVPVPVDLTPGRFNMDPDQAARRLGPRTRAILATHLFGDPCDVTALADLAREHELLLVEDCAQALGCELAGGRKVGTSGDGAILSFDLLKTVNTFGGGAILTRSRETSERVADLLARFEPAGPAVLRRVAMGLVEHAALLAPTAPALLGILAHPRSRPLISRAYRNMQHAVRPTRARYSNLQAMIGCRLLDSLDARVALRREMARKLAEYLGEPDPAGGVRGSNGYFFVRLARGDVEALRWKLYLRGIDAGIGAEVADYCGDLGRPADCPEARRTFESAIQLPLHEGLTDADLERIATACAGQLDARQ